MLSIRKLNSREVYVRMIADFLIIHACMLFSITVSVTAYTGLGMPSEADKIAAYFPRYYANFFLPLSLLFPVIFTASGFYTRMRSYTTQFKAFILMRGVGIGLAFFLCANFLVWRGELVPRSVALSFSVLALVAITGSRFLKASLLKVFGRELAQPSPAKQSQNRGTTLVVGGAGYIGSMLVRRLLDRGEKVRILDNMTYGYGAIRDILTHPNLELVAGDCRNIQKVVGAIKGVDSIIHLAAIVGDPACEYDRQTALEVNYAATRMLIEVAKGNGIERFIFASSCSVYGETDGIMDERSTVNPISVYAQTKIDSEKALLEARSDRFHPTIMRLATVFGNSYRPRFDLVVNLLTAKAHQEGVITIYNGQQWRPFIHVRDVAAGLLTILDAPVPVVSGQVYNLGDSRMNFMLFDVADEIRKVFPETRVEHVENTDRRNYRVSFDKVKNQLGFQCACKLHDGIIELRDAFQNGRINDYKDAYYNNQKYLQREGTPANMADFDAAVMAAFSTQTRSGAAAVGA